MIETNYEGGNYPPFLLFRIEDKYMKLTEQRLKQIILEELATMNEEDKVAADVESVGKQLPRIDTPKEYAQMLVALLKHDFGNEAQKRAVLLKIKPMFLELIQSAGSQEPQEEK